MTSIATPRQHPAGGGLAGGQVPRLAPAPSGPTQSLLHPAGASAFAELVGIACAGACFEAAAVWSTVAVWATLDPTQPETKPYREVDPIPNSAREVDPIPTLPPQVAHGDAPVADPFACAMMCSGTAGCEVFTWHEEAEQGGRSPPLTCDSCPADAPADTCGCGVCGSYGACTWSCTADPTASPPRYACQLLPRPPPLSPPSPSPQPPSPRNSGTCRLMRALPIANMPVLIAAANTTSGAASCGVPFLPFPDALGAYTATGGGGGGGGTTDTSRRCFSSSGGSTAILAPSSGSCYPTDAVFGYGPNACAQSYVIEVRATAEALRRGEWEDAFPAAAARTALSSEPSAASCQADCAALTPCGGFTLSSGVCVLRSQLDCSPAFDAAPGKAVPSELLGWETVSGLREGCVNAQTDVAGAVAAPRCGLPRCRSTSLDGSQYFERPKGGARADTLVSPSCFYAVYERNAALARLAGAWVVVAAGSNGLLAHSTLVNMLEPGQLATFTAPVAARVSETSLVDAVWERQPSGKFSLAYLRSVPYDDWYGDAYSGLSKPAKLRRALGDAPAYAGTGSVRLTLLTEHYFPSIASAALPVLQDAPGGWSTAALTLNVQVSRWYKYCGVNNVNYCPRDDLQGIGSKATAEAFGAELGAFLEAAEPLCSGEANSCFLWSDTYGSGSLLNNKLQVSLSEAQAPWVSLLDVYALTRQVPSEVVQGHASPFVYIWVWTLVLNALPWEDAEHDNATRADADADADATFGHGCVSSLKVAEACHSDTMCSACDNCTCPGYDALCVGSAFECRDWECMHSRFCTYAASPAAEFYGTSSSNGGGALGGGGGGACGVRDLAAEIEAAVAAALSVSDDACPPNLLWCATDAEAWMMAALALLACGVVIIYQISMFEVSPAAVARRAAAGAASGGSGAGAADSVKASVYVREIAHGYFFPPKKPSKGEHLAGLNFARILASIHIVVGHLYAKGAVASVYAFGWGFTWVPWFFMLSGYVLTHAQLARKARTMHAHHMHHAHHAQPARLHPRCSLSPRSNHCPIVSQPPTPAPTRPRPQPRTRLGPRTLLLSRTPPSSIRCPLSCASVPRPSTRSMRWDYSSRCWCR